MEKPDTPQAFVEAAPEHWRSRLEELRMIMHEREELQEAIKWAFPVYSLGKKNVASIFHSKAYVGVWFPQGALLKDPAKRLVNASPEKTVAQRQLRFGIDEAIDAELIRAYLDEAIENQQMGLELKPQAAAEAVVPELLQRSFEEDPDLATAYAAFAPYKRREFCESISTAKREATQLRRLEKVITHIREGKGLSDKYRNC